jgi:Ca-activated chloride channel family protein
MRFDSPQILSFIPAAVVVLGIFYLWARRRRARLLGRFGRHGTVAKLMRGVSAGRQHLKLLLLATGVALVLFSIARPQYGAIERPLRRRGVEVLVAVDCSMSMLGQDIQPNRMTRARQQLGGLIQRLRGDRVGIIAFAGIPIVQCPLTTDYDMALNLLDAIGVDTVPVQGTAIGEAIRKATATFSPTGGASKVLVLLTDGEDHDSDPLKAAEEAAGAGVRIYAIGIGSTEGTPIAMPDGAFKEWRGSKVNTRLDFETLRQIALATGGMAIQANPSGDLELKEIVKAVMALKEGDLESTSLVLHEERFQFFLTLALAALGAEMLLSDRKRRVALQGAGRFD